MLSEELENQILSYNIHPIAEFLKPFCERYHRKRIIIDRSGENIRFFILNWGFQNFKFYLRSNCMFLKGCAECHRKSKSHIIYLQDHIRTIIGKVYRVDKFCWKDIRIHHKKNCSQYDMLQIYIRETC